MRDGVFHGWAGGRRAANLKRVADPLYLSVANAIEGANLVRALGRHGLSAGLVRSDARWQIEINWPPEDRRLFLARADVGSPMEEVIEKCLHSNP